MESATAEYPGFFSGGVCSNPDQVKSAAHVLYFMQSFFCTLLAGGCEKYILIWVILEEQLKMQRKKDSC